MKLKKLLKRFVPQGTPMTLHLVEGDKTIQTVESFAFAIEYNYPDWLKFHVLQISVAHDTLDIVVTRVKNEIY